MVIVAAVDRSERAETVVIEAASLAAAFGQPLHVIHVLTRSDFVDLETASIAENDEVTDIEQVRNAAADIAAKKASPIDRPIEAVGLMGNPAERIVEYAEDHDARYIVTAPRKRSPAGKAVFGSTAQSILLNADSPVVTASTQ